MKYCFNAIYFTRFIFVNSIIVSSIISCNDLYQDFIIMYVWYFVSRNSISVLGAIWPSLSPCTVINPILLTYLLVSGSLGAGDLNFSCCRSVSVHSTTRHSEIIIDEITLCYTEVKYLSCVFIVIPGPVSLTVFPSQFKLDGNFVSLSPRF